MVHASVEVCLGKIASLTYNSVNWKVVRDVAITPYSTLCTRIQVRYQVDELRRYSAEGQDSPEYISVHRVQRLAEIHIGCPQTNAKVTLGEDTECQDAIYGRLFGCETRLLMALVSEQLLADPIEENSSQGLAWHREEGNSLWLLHSWVSPFPFHTGMTTPRLQSVGMTPVFQMEHNRVCNHRKAAVPLALNISA